MGPRLLLIAAGVVLILVALFQGVSTKPAASRPPAAKVAEAKKSAAAAKEELIKRKKEEQMAKLAEAYTEMPLDQLHRYVQVNDPAKRYFSAKALAVKGTRESIPFMVDALSKAFDLSQKKMNAKARGNLNSFAEELQKSMQKIAGVELYCAMDASGEEKAVTILQWRKIAAHPDRIPAQRAKSARPAQAKEPAAGNADLLKEIQALEESVQDEDAPSEDLNSEIEGRPETAEAAPGFDQ